MSADSERVARGVFTGLILVAIVYFLVVGRDRWFFFDEWGFLASRSLNLHDLLEQHGGHLVALPVVVYRTLFTVFGLRSYLPYQAVVVVLHVTTAWLLRVVMRRAGVAPWIATAAATLFLFFGAGGQNILWAFQISFVGSLAFGLAQFLLADHDGDLDRRDWFGLAMGLAAITCSGVGVTMLGVVGVGALIRRGWRVAALHTAPLLALWLLWRQHYAAKSPHTTSVPTVFRWARGSLQGAFNAMGQVPFVGWVLAAVLVVGLVCAWRSVPREDRRRGAAIPVAFLAGLAAFLVTTGVSRASFGLFFATSSRYLYVAAALLLPPLAVAADAIARRRHVLGPVMVVLLLVGIPGNLSKTTASFDSAPLTARYRQMMLSVARLPLAKRVPRSLRPEPMLAPDVTIGWLRDEIRSGRVPRPKPATPRDRATYTLRVALEQLDRGNRRDCPSFSSAMNRSLRTGQSVVVRGGVAVELLRLDGSPLSDAVPFGTSFSSPRAYHTLLAVVQPLAVRIVPASPGGGVC